MTKNSFRNKYSLDQRKTESHKILTKYPDKIPIIVTKSNNTEAKKLPSIDKNKFLSPEDITLSQFIYVIRKRISLNPKRVYLFF